MKFLLDVSAAKVVAKAAAYPDHVAGQLITPLTKYRLGTGGVWAADNGAFSRFDSVGYRRMLKANRGGIESCLFLTVPDVVGSARRTLEVFDCWCPQLERWPVALVLQDGIEDLPIPWNLIAAVFVGGSTGFKDGQNATDCIKAALAIGKHVHVGRVNTVRRFRHFEKLGANTCDGSGVCRYDWMLERIAAGATDDNLPLFSECDSEDDAGGNGVRCRNSAAGLCAGSSGDVGDIAAAVE